MINKTYKKLTSITLVSLLVFSFLSSLNPAYATINETFNFQAKLTNVNGTNVTDGTFNFRFSIYDAASAGNCLWTSKGTIPGSGSCTFAAGSPGTDLVALTVTNGLVNTQLGTIAGSLRSFEDVSASLAQFSNNSLYLDIQIYNGSSWETFGSRKLLQAVPYAFRAKYADTSTNVALSGITAATTTNTIDSLLNAQTWNWSSLSTQNALTFSSNGISTGNLLSLSSSSTALTSSSLLNILATGDPAASWTGALAKIEYTTSTDVDINGDALRIGIIGAGAGQGTALNITTAQTGTNALAFRVNDDGTYTDSTPFAIDKAGNTSIGSTTFTSLLNVGSSAQFQVNSSGQITAAGIVSSGTIQFSALTSNGAVYTSGGNGTLTTTAPTSGALGYWSRSGTTLSPTTANDVISISGNTSDIIYATSDSNTANNKVLNVFQSGATSGTDYAGYFYNSGGATTNVAIYATAAFAATNNYAIITNGGNVGIGDTSPVSLLTVGNGDLFQVNSSGQIAAAAGITSSGTITFSGLSAMGAIVSTTGGQLTSVTSTTGNFLRHNGTTWVASTIQSGDVPTGSANYIQNQLAGAQSSSNFWISGNGAASSLSLGSGTQSSLSQNIFSTTSTLPTTKANTYLETALSTTGTFYGERNVITNAGAYSSTYIAYGNHIDNSTVATDTATVTTSSVYGVYSTVANTPGAGSTDASTRNAYAGTFIASGNTLGTSTTMALYATAAGADTNYAIYSGGGNNYFSGNTSIGSTTFTSLFNIGSAAQFQVNSAGEIFNSTSSSGISLFVENLGSGYSFKVTDSAIPDLTPFTIDESGNVSIGTINRSEKLNIAGNIVFDAGSTIYTKVTGSPGNPLSITAQQSTSSSGGDIKLDGGSGATTSGNVLLGTVNTGNVGIGDATPASALTVGNGDLFQVNSSGNIVKINNVITSFPGSQGAANSVLVNNGSGTLSWGTTLTGVTVPISKLAVAAATNTIDNTLYAQQWDWSTLSTQNALTLTGNGITTGNLFSLTSTSTALTSSSLLNILATGDPAASWTGALAKIEYTTSTSVNINGDALRIGIRGIGTGQGTTLNITSEQTGTNAFVFKANDDGTYTDSTAFSIDKAGVVRTGEQILVPDSGAGGPSFAFINNPNMGFYRLANNVMGTQANGQGGFYLDGTSGTGRVSIDYPVATVSKFQISNDANTAAGGITLGTSAGTYIQIYKSASNQLAIMGGSVGIGDASPLSLLTVGNGDLFQVNSSGNIVASGLTAMGAIVSTTSGQLTSVTSTTGNFLRHNGTTWVASTIASGDIPTGSANYIQNQSSSAQTGNSWISGMTGIANGDLGGGGTIRFRKADNSGWDGGIYQANNNELYLQSGAGNIIHFRDNSSLDMALFNKTLGANFFNTTDDNNVYATLVSNRNRSSATAPGAGFGSEVQFILEGFTNTSTPIASAIRTIWENNQTNDTTDRDSTLSFSTMLDNSLTAKMTILSSGNVGIGQTSPLYKLDITGNTRFNGNVLNTSGVNGIGDQDSRIPNTGFEINDDPTTTVADGWTQFTVSGSGGTASVSTTKIQGTNSQAVVLAANTDGVGFYSPCIPITGGNSYTLYTFARDLTTASNTNALTLRLGTYTSAANCSSRTTPTNYDSVTNGTVTTTFAQYGGTVTPAATQFWGRVEVQFDTPTTADTFYADSVRLTVSSLAAGVDLAESFPIENGYIVEPGDIVSVSSTNSDSGIKYIKKSSGEFDSSVVGIVSTKPGITLDDGNTYAKAKVALAGRVPVKISTSSEAIKSGDYITSSSEEGKAMKASRTGQVIGKALNDWDPLNPTEKIVVLIDNSYYYHRDVEFAAFTDRLNALQNSVDGQTQTLNSTNQLLNTTLNSNSTSVTGPTLSGTFEGIDLTKLTSLLTKFTIESDGSLTFNSKTKFSDQLSVDSFVTKKISSDSSDILIELNETLNKNKLLVANRAGAELFSIDYKGNAKFAKDVTINGDLYVDGKIAGKSVFESKWTEILPNAEVSLNHALGSIPRNINILRTDKDSCKEVNGEMECDNVTNEGFGNKEVYYYKNLDKSSIKVVNALSEPIYVKVTITK